MEAALPAAIKNVRTIFSSSEEFSITLGKDSMEF